MTIAILDPGALTSVQDPRGRREWRHLGVGVGGAADAWSARLANRLVGNADDAALLEMTLHGATLRFDAAATIALTGGLAAAVDGLPLVPAQARRVRARAVVRVGSGPGARGYLAVAGGLAVPSVLGSRATDLRSGFGGLEGRALRAGDRLPTGTPAGGPMRMTADVPASAGPIRITDGPRARRLLEGLVDRELTVGPEADRTGVRLTEALRGGGETASMGLPLGAIQVAPDGRPIVMLADRPVTGGYRVPAVVIGADIGRVAQLRPGDTVRFASVSMAEAHAAWRAATEKLAALEPADRPEDDELGWTGSHR